VGDVDVYRHGRSVRAGSAPAIGDNLPPVAEGNPLRGTAIALGALGVLAMLIGLVTIVLADPGEGSPTGGVLIRTGAVLGAIALVLPSIRKPSLPTVLVAGAGLVLVLVRPGLVWAALIGWVAWVLLSRQRRTESSDS
jgi:hypothetical protein